MTRAGRGCPPFHVLFFIFSLSHRHGCIMSEFLYTNPSGIYRAGPGARSKIEFFFFGYPDALFSSCSKMKTGPESLCTLGSLLRCPKLGQRSPDSRHHAMGLHVLVDLHDLPIRSFDQHVHGHPVQATAADEARPEETPELFDESHASQDPVFLLPLPARRMDSEGIRWEDSYTAKLWPHGPYSGSVRRR